MSTWAAKRYHPTLVSLLFFGFGFVGAMILWFTTPLSEVFVAGLSSGYGLTFLAGMLYSNTLTSTTAMLAFLSTDSLLNPIFVAIVGGLGATVYDLLVYFLLRQRQDTGPLHRLHDWIQRRRARKFFSVVVGSVVIASPLPDELGVALMGLSELPKKFFLPLTFALNTVGIFIIAELGTL